MRVIKSIHFKTTLYLGYITQDHPFVKQNLSLIFMKNDYCNASGKIVLKRWVMRSSLKKARCNVVSNNKNCKHFYWFFL